MIEVSSQSGVVPAPCASWVGAGGQPSFTPTEYRVGRLQDMPGHRRDPSPQATASALSLVTRRLGLLTLAVFVVVMHHVVGAHEHEGAALGLPSTSMSTMAAPLAHAHGVGSTSLSGPRDIGPADLALDVAEVAGHRSAPQTLSVAVPEAESGMLAMLHLCLAVLAALVVLVALFLALIIPRPLSAVTGGRARAPSEFPRPPPSQRRLAHLQVLRL